MAMGKRSAANPKISPTLAMFEPTTLPTAIASAPFKVAVRLAANSGALVPKATTVRPMTKGLSLKRRAKLEANLTNSSPPP